MVHSPGKIRIYSTFSSIAYRRSLEDIVRNRIGVDVFTSRMVRIRNVLNTFMAIGNVTDEGRNTTLYDRSFAELFMGAYDSILEIFMKIGKSSQYGLPRTVEKFVETEDILTSHTSRFEVESLRTQLHEMQIQQPSSLTSHEKNVESKCAYLASENVRLRAMVDAYSEQLRLIERDNEELLMTLGTCEAELKQLKQLKQQSNGIGDSIPVENLVDLSRSTRANSFNHQSEHVDLPQPKLSDSPLQPEPVVNVSTSPSKSNLQTRLEALVHTTSPSTATHDV